jgi:hypothetical protein
VLGEREQRTCESCTKTQTTPGVGLTPVIQEEYETKLQALQELVTGAKPTTVTNLEAAGSNSLPITRGLIEALRDEPDQDLLGKRLASEAALSSVLEKALLLQRALLTGKKEPNVAANELAVKAVDQENGSLEQEINNLKTELELRRTLAGNSAMAIVQRHGTRASRLARHLRGRHHARPAQGSAEAEVYAMSTRAWLKPMWLFNRPCRPEPAVGAGWWLGSPVGVNVAGIHLDRQHRRLGALAARPMRATSSPGGCCSTARRPMVGGGCANA